MSEVICKRCGLCCKIVLEGRISNIPCRFLMPVGNNRFICKIYMCENRIGHDIGNGNFCHKRESIHLNYRNCPYNKKEYGKELDIGDGVETKKE
jgi:hypothetical protein